VDFERAVCRTLFRRHVVLCVQARNRDIVDRHQTRRTEAARGSLRDFREEEHRLIACNIQNSSTRIIMYSSSTFVFTDTYCTQDSNKRQTKL
jgi:hypothetical protein